MVVSVSNSNNRFQQSAVLLLWAIWIQLHNHVLIISIDRITGDLTPLRLFSNLAISSHDCACVCFVLWATNNWLLLQKL